MREEYALEIRVNGSFDRQIDVYNSIEAAERAAEKVTLNSNEDCDIVRIEYDDNGNEISATSIY